MFVSCCTCCELHVVRASPCFYGNKRFDFVSYSRPRRNSRCYSQLHLLFKATSKVAPDRSQLASPTEQEFAFLGCFVAAPGGTDDKLVAAGCVRIKPDALHNRPWYEVVPFSSLLSREFVTEKCNEAGVHYASCFVSN